VINEEVRHIIEAELVSDEELLWAEKVDAEQVDAFIQSKIRSDKLWIPVFCVVIFMFSKLLIDAFPLDVKSRMDLIVTVFGLILIVCLIALLTCCVLRMGRSFKSNVNYAHYQNLLGYGISNQRVFYLNKTSPLIDIFERQDLKVWKSFHRRDLLSGIISKSLLLDHAENYAGTSTIEFKFLQNAEKSYADLENLLGRKSS